jgi:3-oxoacyl-[acyl-carrier protein] reductase
MFLSMTKARGVDGYRHLGNTNDRRGVIWLFSPAFGRTPGIRVNAVAPGVIDTDMSHFTKTEEGRSTVMGMQTLKRIGQPEDVASVIAFLVSDDARWITGETIAVDGGSKL